MKLFLVRHGKTDAEINGVRQTQDTPLGEQGRKEVAFLANEFEGKRIDAIISSPWTRARETAEAIAAKLNLPITYTDLVRERAHDKRLQGAPIDSEVNMQYMKQMEESYFDFDWNYLDDEPLSKVVERAKKIKDSLFSEYKEKEVILVSHGIFFRCFLSLCLLGENFDKKAFMRLFHSFTFRTASVTLLEYDFNHSLWKINYFGKKNIG